MADDGVADATWPLLADWTKRSAGIVLEGARLDTFRERIGAICRDQGSTPGSLLERLLRGDRSAMLTAVDAASTNYTEFFREREAFDRIHAEVFPSFTRPEPRLWSAACATGEEPYSLAILVRESVLDPRRVRILGTDLTERNVAAAERGSYAAHRLHSLAPSERRAMEPLGLGRFTPDATTRSLCTFRRLNLLAPPYPFSQPFDLVLCRNVLYYFDGADRSRVTDAIFDVTTEGGWLVISYTDPPVVGSRWRSKGPGFYRKVA